MKGVASLGIPGKANHELLEKFDNAEAVVSIVEHTAIERIEAQERYKRHLAEAV